MSDRRLRFLLVLFASSGVACSKNLDMKRIKADIKAGIEQQSGVTVSWVECPETRKAKPGDRFECRAGIEGGSVTIDVVQDDYANAKWAQREQALDLREVELTVQAGLLANAKVAAKVECEGARRPSVPGTRFVCQGTLDRDKSVFEVPIAIKDEKGAIDWSVPKSVLTAPIKAR